MEPDLLSQNQDLLARFREGRRDALEQVFRHYQGLVRTIASQGFPGCRGMTQLHDIEDVISATFASAFDQRGRLAYDGLQPYSRFLAGIARNTLRSNRRKQGLVLEPEQAGELPDQAPGPAEQAESSQESELVNRFREFLGDRDLVQVFELYFGEGLSEANLAGRLGMNRYRLRLKLARVRKKMNRFLQQEGLA